MLGEGQIKGRFIPVYTGNIGIYIKNNKQVPVYPCVYREHSVLPSRNASFSGLSLCIQGTYGGNHHSVRLNRFIPVYTGNINKKANKWQMAAVYPCVYREHTNYNILFYN